MGKTTFAALMQIPSDWMNAVQESARNLVINGNFAINQRNYVSGTNTIPGYPFTLDRWMVVTTGQNLTYAASGTGRLVTAPAGGLEQVIEGSAIAGGTYCLSWTGTATAKVNGVAIVEGGTVVLPANTNVRLRFTGGTVTNVMFHEGSFCLPYEQRHPALELALCQRYSVPQRRLTLEVGASSTATLQALDRFPVPMRAAPTLVYTDAAGNENRITKLVNGVATNNITPTTGTLTSTADGIEATFTLSAGMSGFQIKYTADAELL